MLSVILIHSSSIYATEAIKRYSPLSAICLWENERRSRDQEETTRTVTILIWKD